MNFDYLVTIVTTQTVDGDDEVIKVITHAAFEGERNDYVISYKEHGEGGEESFTRLHVENGEKVTVHREGEIKTDMSIIVGKRTVSHHVTPYGIVSMGIMGSDVVSDMDSSGGTLRFRYFNDVEGELVGSIEFDIILKSKNKLHQ